MQGVQILKSQLAKGESRFGNSNSGIKSQSPYFIFLAPPSIQDLEKRLRGRGTETEESLQKRLDAASKEMEWGTKNGAVDLVILNDDVDRAYSELHKAIVHQ